jgi:trk system potassium uptake protein TrkH
MWRPVLMINGYVIFILGAMMMLPAYCLAYFTGTPDYIFLQSGFTAMFFGALLFLANYGKIQNISILQGYLITVSCWFIAPIICAIPLYQNGSIATLSDAIFEATSGVTATGATILTHIESEPKSVLLWRSILNGLGGIGIVIFAVALLPFLGIGGMHMFNKENSDTEEKFLPKFRDIVKDIILVYISLNILCSVLLKYFGMNWFDAVNHALTTVCTGGFSTKTASIGAFKSAPIEAIVVLFMLLGALPLTYFVLLYKKKKFSFMISNPQVNTFLKIVVFYTLGLSVFYSLTTSHNFGESLRIIGFNLVSAITTTGFTASDYLDWGVWAPALFLILILHGGCTGSTSGSIKIFRWQVAAAYFKKNAVTALSPNQVVVMKTGDKLIRNDIVMSVLTLILSFLLAILFFTLVLSFSGVDLLTSLSAVSATITSFGPGITAATGPAGSYALFSPFVKYVLAFVMVLGRLEVITVLILIKKIKIS